MKKFLWRKEFWLKLLTHKGFRKKIVLRKLETQSNCRTFDDILLVI